MADEKERLEAATKAIEASANAMEHFATAATDLAKAAGSLELTVLRSQEEATKAMVTHIKRSKLTRESVEDRMRQLDEEMRER